VEDWVETYQQTANDDVSERAAVQELVLFVVRTCGLASDVDEDEAMDVDGVLDTVERIQDESVRVWFLPLLRMNKF
jgi:cohesin complex subunit SA-1/2